MTLARRVLTPVEPAVQRVTTIPTTCRRHGSEGFTNLRIQRNGMRLELNPHVDNGCILSLDATAAERLRAVIDAFLG